jgi:hypothetical protein
VRTPRTPTAGARRARSGRARALPGAARRAPQGTQPRGASHG